MVPTTYVRRTLISLALVGVAAVFVGILLGFGASRSVAGASPVTLPAGTLGVGVQRVAPLDETACTLAGVSVAAARTTAASLTATAPLAAAPIPRKVVRRPAVRRATVTRASASVGSASVAVASGGWKSAKASWYGPGFYGRKTASGAVYTQTMLNVAHKSLPFGTRIEFEYGGRRVVAVVNDRGPFVAGRTFDLGAGTAKALGFGGVHVVRYRILGR